MTENKSWKKALTILLIFQIVVALSLAIYALVDFAGIVEQFGMKYQTDMGILQLIMTYNLVLSSSICLWSVIWIRKGNLAGIQAGTTVGFLIFMVSFAVFLKYDRIDMLLFDSLRAALMVVFGLLAYKERTKFQTLHS
jgi:heme/copper-type cytochrome/quinol oxidase subunit 3